jgi:pimeloyl-ACP methyl ester carboxylesterase
MAGNSIGTIPVDGGRIAYHRLGSGRPLLVLNGLAATSADWDPSFIERLASANELILALQHPGRIDKLILLSTDPGGVDAELASPAVRSQLIDTSGTPREQARRLLSLLFPGALADSIYDQYGDIVAAARAQLSPNLVQRQAAAMDAWHRDGAGSRLQELRTPTFVAAGTEDIVIPASNALTLVNAIPGAWLAQFKEGGHAFMAQYPRPLADLINGFLAL